MKPVGAALRTSSQTDPSRRKEACIWRSHNTSLVALVLIATVAFTVASPCLAAATPPEQPQSTAELLTPEEAARISSMVFSEVERRDCQARLEDDFLFITFPDGEEHSFIIRDLQFCAHIMSKKHGAR